MPDEKPCVGWCLASKGEAPPFISHISEKVLRGIPGAQSNWKKNRVSAQTTVFTVLCPCACPQAIIKNLLTTRYPVNHGSPPPPFSTNKCSELEGGLSFKCLLYKHEDPSLILSTSVINLAWQHTSGIPIEGEKWVSEVHSPDSLA